MRADKASILSTLYNLLWYQALPFALLAAHPASMRDYRERMGHGDFPDTAGAPRIGVHAASVCEIEAIRPVANGLLEHYPGAVMAITAMTAAGRDTAKPRIPGRRLDACAVGQSARVIARRMRRSGRLTKRIETWSSSVSYRGL